MLSITWQLNCKKCQLVWILFCSLKQINIHNKVICLTWANVRGKSSQGSNILSFRSQEIQKKLLLFFAK